MLLKIVPPLPHGARTGLLLQLGTFSQTLGANGQSIKPLLSDDVCIKDDINVMDGIADWRQENVKAKPIER